GRFVGTVVAENIQGQEIAGVTFRTGRDNDKYIHMQEQEVTLWDGSLDKLHIGFRNEYGNPTEKPYMIWEHGQPDGTDKMVMEKGSRNFYMRYSSQRGTTGLEMNYSGSVSLISEYTLSLHSRNSIEADNNIYAPDFIKSSTV